MTKKTTKNEVATVDKNELTFQERFTNKIIELFSAQSGAETELTAFQKRLAQSYCLDADRALKAAEIKRLARNERYRDPLPCIWANVAMIELAEDVVDHAKMGLDPAQRNHVNLIPFKDNALKQYRMTFIKGYRGLEIIAKKYGLEIPDNITVDLIYSKDKFREVKKDRNNPIETYEFEIVNSLDRGEVAGGFYYYEYFDNPTKNRLVVMNLQEILKRKPSKAAPDFWGGEKDVWKDGKVVGKEKVEGWYKEMCWKTVARAAYGDIATDSEKIDASYMRSKALEKQYAEIAVEEEIAGNANTVELDFDDKDMVEAGVEIIEEEPNESVDTVDVPEKVEEEIEFPDFLQ